MAIDKVKICQLLVNQGPPHLAILKEMVLMSNPVVSHDFVEIFLLETIPKSGKPKNEPKAECQAPAELQLN